MCKIPFSSAVHTDDDAPAACASRLPAAAVAIRVSHVGRVARQDDLPAADGQVQRGGRKPGGEVRQPQGLLRGKFQGDRR